MGVAELQEAWQEHSAAIAAEYADWDNSRIDALPAYLDALNSFLRGRTDVETFRSRIDSLSKSEPWWGFRGTSQMFFNQLVKAADPAALAQALREALPAPTDDRVALEKLEDFQTFIEDTRDRAEVTGATKPGIGRTDSFVSFFWELQDRERWPVFFPNSRDVLEQQGLLDVSLSQPQLYLAYRDVIQGLKDELGTETWGVEHLLWRLGKAAEQTEEKGSAEPAPAEPGPSLYAHFREQDLHFPDEVVTSLVLSLATKRFVILSGISGTGKTKIALGLAAYLESLGPGAPEPAAPEAPANDPDNVYIPLTAAKIRRGTVSLITDARTYVRRKFGLPARGTSGYFVAKLPDGRHGRMRLHNIGFSDTSRELYRLHLGNDASDWLRENGRPGDLLHFKLRGKGDVQFEVELISGVPAAPADEAADRRHVTIAVRSDWTDPRGLIGYFNPLTSAYVRTDLIDLMLRAADDPGNPYLLILDEMNLARVEYYFSDFLSALESGEDLRLMAPGVEELSAASSDEGGEAEVPGELSIPPNVSFIGTVNVDETTHAFSPKVLDRANVIEFGEVDVERALGHGVEKDTGGLRLKGKLAPQWLCTSREEAMLPRAVARELDDFTGALEDVHAILAEANLPFGYRVIDEVSAFVGHAFGKAEGEEEEIVRRAFDLQLQQKIVPKLSGGRELEAPLAALLDYCLDGEKRAAVDAEQVRGAARKRLKPVDGGPPPRYPGSARRILRMLDRLAATGFVGALE